MPKGGLEPPRVSPYAPQTYVSTNSTTSAIYQVSKVSCSTDLESKPCGHFFSSGFFSSGFGGFGVAGLASDEPVLGAT